MPEVRIEESVLAPLAFGCSVEVLFQILFSRGCSYFTDSNKRNEIRLPFAAAALRCLKGIWAGLLGDRIT